MAAISAALMATLKAGDHVVMPCAPHPYAAAALHSGRPRSAHAGPHLASTRPPARGACNGLLTRLPAPARVAVAVYGGTNEFMSQFMTQWGVEWTLVDATDPNEFVKAIRPNTKVTSGPASSRSCVACAGADGAHARQADGATTQARGRRWPRTAGHGLRGRWPTGHGLGGRRP